MIMMVNTTNLVSITEANQNFSKVARLVDERGSAVILKNNVPRYLVIEFNQAEIMQDADDEDDFDYEYEEVDWDDEPQK